MKNYVFAAFIILMTLSATAYAGPSHEANMPVPGSEDILVVFPDGESFAIDGPHVFRACDSEHWIDLGLPDPAGSQLRGITALYVGKRIIEVIAVSDDGLYHRRLIAGDCGSGDSGIWEMIDVDEAAGILAMPTQTDKTYHKAIQSLATMASITTKYCPANMISTITDAAKNSYSKLSTLTGKSRCSSVTITCKDTSNVTGDKWTGSSGGCGSIYINFPFKSVSAGDSRVKYLIGHEISHRWRTDERCADGAATYVFGTWPISASSGAQIAPCSTYPGDSVICSGNYFSNCRRTSRALFWGKNQASLKNCLLIMPTGPCQTP